jgi:hypothetical protein
MKAKKKYKRGGKLPVKSGRPARTEASIREEHRKQTSGKSKPAVKIQNTPMERIADTGLKEKVYKEMSDEFSKSGQPRMTANQLAMATINMTYPAKVKKIGEKAGAKTYGQLADSVEKYTKYSKGGGLYKEFEEKANKGNNAAKYLETGKGPDGMPLSARTRAMYKAIAKKNKNIHLMSPAPFEDDGVRKKGGKMPKYRKGGPVHTDEMGRKGHFNPFTKKTRGASSRFAPVDTQYPSEYQNKILKPTSRASGYAKKVGYQEEKMRSGFKMDSVLGLRRDAYQSNQNNFGVKKNKVKIR